MKKKQTGGFQETKRKIEHRGSNDRGNNEYQSIYKKVIKNI